MKNVQYILMVLLMVCGVSAGTRVFFDNIFPYRVVSPDSWEEVEKNESLLRLQDMTPGKKTQLLIWRYTINTEVISDTTNWSRVNYMVNHDLANELGDVVWDDTGKSIVLGDLRAFELFAFVTQEIGEKTVRWADLSRWTERNSYGYLVQIIGDTLDMMRNLTEENSSYRALMDSISIKEFSTPVANRPLVPVPATSIGADYFFTWYDLLGRRTLPPEIKRNTVLLHDRGKVLLLREPSVR